MSTPDTGEFQARFETLKADAKVASEPHHANIRAALEQIDASLEALKDLGLTVDVNWPFGRGSVAKATSTRVTCSMKLEL